MALVPGKSELICDVRVPDQQFFRQLLFADDSTSSNSLYAHVGDDGSSSRHTCGIDLDNQNPKDDSSTILIQGNTIPMSCFHRVITSKPLGVFRLI